MPETGSIAAVGEQPPAVAKRAADRATAARSVAQAPTEDRLAPRGVSVSAPGDRLAGMLARAVAQRRSTALLQRAKVTYTAFENSRVATSHQTVHNLRGDERYRFGDHDYDVHFHANGWNHISKDLTSFTGTFRNEWGDVRHITLTELEAGVWIANPDRNCDEWNYLNDALDATYERLGRLIGIPSRNIERTARRKVGAYVPPHLRNK